MSLIEEIKSINDNMEDDIYESICTSESVRGNNDCGEPFVGQRILLDFTPNDEDNDAVQAKCCALWEFINNQHEFKIRQPSQESVNDNPESKMTSTSRKSNKVRLRSEKTAVSMLEFVEEKARLKESDKLKKVKDGSKVTSGTVHSMCQKLQAWDLDHPKSMEPPGPVPVLHEYK